MFDPNKKWTEEEIEELRKEDSLYNAIHKYSFEDLLDEVPSYKLYMENMQKKKPTVELYTCNECGKKMPAYSKDLHPKYCKSNGEDAIQRDKTS